MDTFKFEDPAYVLTFCFTRAVDSAGNVYYFAASQAGREGYLIVWPDGSQFHTYHYPPNFME